MCACVRGSPFSSDITGRSPVAYAADDDTRQLLLRVVSRSTANESGALLAGNHDLPVGMGVSLRLCSWSGFNVAVGDR